MRKHLKILLATVAAASLLTLPACSTTGGTSEETSTSLISTSTVQTAAEKATALAISAFDLTDAQIDYLYSISTALRQLMDGTVPTPSDVLAAIDVELGDTVGNALDAVAVAVTAVYQSFYSKFSDSSVLSYLEAIAAGVEAAALAAQ